MFACPDHPAGSICPRCADSRPQRKVWPEDIPGYDTDMQSKINPKHYAGTDTECIDVVRNMPHCLAAAMAYLWRCDQKGSFESDVRKAIWYLWEELDRRGLPSKPRSER